MLNCEAILILDKKNFYLPVLIILALHICHTSSYSLSFGKNKVRVDIHKWQITETPHFIVYYYPESEPLLDKVGYYLEKAYKHVTEDLDVTLSDEHVDHTWVTYEEIVKYKIFPELKEEMQEWDWNEIRNSSSNLV